MKNRIIKIVEEVTVGNVILEVGDKIEVLKEMGMSMEFQKLISRLDQGNEYALGEQIGYEFIEALTKLGYTSNSQFWDGFASGSGDAGYLLSY